MYQSELDISYARERYNDYLVAARIQRLIRSARSAEQQPARPARQENLLARVLDALRPRYAARA